MFFENINDLLEPGYLSMETGYRRLANGQMYIAVLTQMPGCKTRWLDWWFKNYHLKKGIENRLENVEQFKSSKKKHKIKGIEAEYSGKYLMDQKISKYKFRLIDPAKYFDEDKLKENKSCSIICVDTFYSNETLSGHSVSIARNTEYGCEIRRHLWLDDCTEERARTRMEHTMTDMGNLANFLRITIENIKLMSGKPNVVCKVCHNDDVVKNGLRKNGQYWLCKSCGHCFLDNKALPSMKYPVDVVARAVNDYNLGKHLRLIRNDISKNTNCVPSNSALYGWIKKFTDMALC
jgi:transposase-like protein